MADKAADASTILWCWELVCYIIDKVKGADWIPRGRRKKLSYSSIRAECLDRELRPNDRRFI